MKKILNFGLLFLFLISLASCNGQAKNEQIPKRNNKNKIVGGGCDGCELMYVGMPKNIKPIDTSSAWNGKGQKLLVTGKILKLDGVTPAPNVIVYYWQTDHNGYYANGEGKSQKHGRTRGWVKSDKQGNYSIYTIRPAPYPNRDIPAHIHLSIKEPEIDDEYYIDNLEFADDILLTGKKRKMLKNRGGSGILRVLIDTEMQVAEHNIILGLNIPNYPITIDHTLKSGLEIGEENPSFTPFHAWGPDKGTRTCPVCKYGRFHGIVYFVGSQPNWSEIKEWLTFLEQESVTREKYLKVYFVYGNKNGYSKSNRQIELEQLGKELNLENIALTFVPSFTDTQSEVHLNKINPKAEHTIIIYRHRNIIGKFVDLKPTKENQNEVSKMLDKTVSKFFELPEPKHH
ncbi:intradiol ring-cleavage dioxygenase [Aquimarina sp. AU58]|uniref:dioxygenase family protein n=1 Tax=Aquimarina sp. AU58 TaxID=1874112 RepID=UPI000D6E12F5|nr:intradiol ring-cleavage dioxygenase [Aquimarina sp. AU58]